MKSHFLYKVLGYIFRRNNYEKKKIYYCYQYTSETTNDCREYLRWKRTN